MNLRIRWMPPRAAWAALLLAMALAVSGLRPSGAATTVGAPETAIACSGPCGDPGGGG